MSSPLSFTPSFSYTQQDAGSTLKIVVDYSSFPDYDDFSELTVNVTTENNSIDQDIDLTSSVVSTLTGTVTASTGDSTLTASGSSFEDEISAGDHISFGDDTDAIYEVDSVTSDTVIILTSPLLADLSGSSMKKFAGAVYLQADDIGLASTAKFPDDIYYFLYEYTFGGGTDENGTYMHVQALSCNTECVINSLIAAIPDNVSCNLCNDDYLDGVVKSYFYYEALKNAAYNGSVDHYNTILSGLCDITENLTTNCGCS